jgi:hypothetical protein
MSSNSTNQPAIFILDYTNFDWFFKKAVSTTHGSKTHPEADSIDLVILDFLGNRSIHPEKNRYHSEDLSKIVIKWTESSYSRAVELDLLKHFKARLPRTKLGNITQEKILPLPKKWFKIFDTIFFHGSLEDRIKIDVFVAKTRDESFIHGCYYTIQRKISINLIPNGVRKYGFRGTPVQYYISTLLHEMLHAFFTIFSCVCEDCKSKEAASKGGLGATGHGPVWMKTCRALEMTLRELTPWHVHLGISNSAYVEEHNSGWQPNFEQRREWGIRIPNHRYSPESMPTESKPHRQVSCLPIL